MKRVVLLGLSLICFVSGALCAAEIRTWTAIDGKSVEAAFVGKRGGLISLKLANGQIVKIITAKLSAEDQAYIEELTNPTVEAAKLPFEYGAVSPEIKLSADDEISYHMFVPESLKSSHAWPIMFVLDPGGGKPSTLDRYIPGAERNAWALVVSVQCANNSQFPVAKSVFAMVDEVLEKYPIDKTRVYASGHSGGSRTAGMLGEYLKKRDFAGLLANGAGVGYKRIFEQSPKSSMYGLCGSNCFNRWDMPSSFEKIRCRNKKFVVFPGRHDWAPEKYLTEGMSALTGWFLKDASKTGTRYAEECVLFAERELREIEALRESEPGKALLRAQLLAEIKLPFKLSTKARKVLTSLKKNRSALHYLEAEKALDKYVVKYFAHRKSNKFYNRADPDAAQAGEALAEKYADTSLKEIFERLAQPSVK